MNYIDAIIIILCILAALRGWRNGFLRQGMSLCGFIAGIFAGALLAPTIAGVATSTTSQILAALTTVFVLALVGATIGEIGGIYLHRTFKRLHIDFLNHIAGIVLGAAATLFSIWLIASILIAAPYYKLNGALQGSSILKRIDSAFGTPPELFAGIEQLLRLGRFPQVFIGIEPPHGPPVIEPGSASVKQIATMVQDSVVKIVGRGCGGIKEGSGFVAAPNEIVTNAHVVSGIDKIYVMDTNGRHEAEVVVFDPNLDIAILKTTKLAGPPLAISTSLEQRGAQGAVLGYPEGGRYTAGVAAVMSRSEATGRNIYGRSIVQRDIYTLQAHVVPGNSGGPFVNMKGAVEGVVFAASTSNENVGYALTAPEIMPSLQKAANRTTAVSTGQCSE